MLRLLRPTLCFSVNNLFLFSRWYFTSRTFNSGLVMITQDEIIMFLHYSTAFRKIEDVQSIVRKTVAAVHFTPMPCEPNTVHRQ